MRKSFLLFVPFIFWGFLEMGAAVAASPDNMLADYSVRQWRGEDGLTEDIVNGVEQSLDGYIWCVTPHQVVRFDGQRFSPVDRSGWPAGAFSCRGVAVDHRGALWLYGEGGVLKHDGHAWGSVMKTSGSNKSLIYTLEEDGSV